MRGAWLLFCVLLCGQAVASAGDVDAYERHLAQQIEHALKEEGLAGAVWATVDAEGRIRTGAAGVRNATAGEPMTAQTRVHVGSITKTLVATGVLQLVSAGRLDLDTPVESVLPGIRFGNPWRDESPVRLRHLLDHTSGLDDLRLWQFFSAQATPDSPLSATFARDPSVLQLRSRPGSRFSYSNMGYTLVGMVIEQVTGERYEAWLDRELLRPLGMRDSTFAFVTQAGAQADPQLSWGHLDDLSLTPALPVYLRPAAQLTTTAHDLALFATFLLGDGRVGQRVLVRPDLLRAMGRPSGTEAASAGLQTGYGLGLSQRDRHGVVGLCHNGSIVGFHAMLCLFPDSEAPDSKAGKVFVIAHNTDREGADYDRFDALIVQALKPPLAVPTPRASASANIDEWQGRYVRTPNKMVKFRYVDFLFDSASLTRNGSSLWLSPLQGDAHLLTPTGGLMFVANDRSSTSHVLLRGERGERLISNGLRTYRQVGAAFYWLHMASLVLGVLGLLWFLLGVPIRGMWKRGSGFSPGLVGVLLLLLPVPLFLMQSFTQLGDRTAASLALYAGTAALPLLMLGQAVLSWRQRRRPGACTDLTAALLVLQWCLVLVAWDMLPFALWR